MKGIKAFLNEKFFILLVITIFKLLLTKFMVAELILEIQKKGMAGIFMAGA
jgi:hypothetical protein